MKTKISLLAIYVLFFISSCSNDSIISSTENNCVIGHLDYESRTLFVSNENMTDTHWVENDSIGLFTSAQQNLLYKAINSGKNTEFLANKTELNFQENNKVRAYYPYTNNINGNNVKLPNTYVMNSTDKTISFMTSDSYVKNGKLNLYFNHIYAYLKIRFCIKNFTCELPENSYKNGRFLLYIKSTDYISAKNAWFNLETKKISNDNNEDLKKEIFYYCNEIDINQTDTFTYMIPILPQAEGTTVNVSLYIPANYEGLDGYYHAPYIAYNKRLPIGGFQAGHVYTLNTINDTKPSLEQFEILKDFFYSTNGYQWNDNKNWLSEKPLKDWYGLNNNIRINSYVNNINLSRNSLTGNLPETFAKLMDTADNIYLQFNGMSGNIPESVKNHIRWNELGWNIIAQDTRLSDGFNLNESNLYLPQTDIYNLFDDTKVDIKTIISKNKLTQCVFLYPMKADSIKNTFTDALIDLNLKYYEKGLKTIIMIRYNDDVSYSNVSSEDIKKSIIKNYENTHNIYWADYNYNYKNSSMLNINCFIQSSYIFNTEGQLIYCAPYITNNANLIYGPMEHQEVVIKKLDSFLESQLCEFNKHDEHK